jgi:hypothetical protein
VAEFARQYYPRNIEISQFAVAALAKPGALRAEVQRDSALSPFYQRSNAEILNDQ